jgi:hypothetical protein
VIKNCGEYLPFKELGFVKTDENIWIKYTDSQFQIPHFILSTTINPTSQTFLIKNLLNQDFFSTNSFEKLKESVMSSAREYKLNKILQ